jgi:hypothetical protein
MAPILKFTLEQLKVLPNHKGRGYYHIRGENLFEYTKAIALSIGIDRNIGFTSDLYDLIRELGTREAYMYVVKYNQW